MKIWKIILGLLLTLGVFGLPLVTFSQAPSSDRAVIRVKIPATATLTIDGASSRQGGADRYFITPSLPAGQTFSYELTASWKENGQDKKVTLQVTVKAGEQSILDFNESQPTTVAKTETLQSLPKKVEPSQPSELPVVKKEVPKPPEPPVVKKEPVKPSEPPVVKKEAPKLPEPPVVKKEEPKPPQPPLTKKAEPKDRTFLFTYAGTVKDLKPGQEAQVWLPQAVSTAEQEVSIESKELPVPEKTGKDKQYGNNILFFQAKADKQGEIPFKVVYKVMRHEVKTDGAANLTIKAKEDKTLLDRFLQPDAKVPTSGKPLELIKDKKLPPDQFAAARVLYDVVNGHMKYSKEGTGWGQGDAVWACDSKFGNCTDFHSLFISMARGNKIPSKFEMGFPLPPKHGAGPIPGYHCWAWFLPSGKGWVPVDISEANRNPDLRDYYFGNLTEDRVSFTRGRDITLEPPQKGPPLNFFIYPYVEVNGQPYPADKIARSFAFQDLPPGK